MTLPLVAAGVLAGVVAVTTFLSLMFEASWPARAAFVALITTGAMLLFLVAWTFAELVTRLGHLLATLHP